MKKTTRARLLEILDDLGYHTEFDEFDLLLNEAKEIVESESCEDE